MRICVVGDCILDVELTGHWGGSLPENPDIPLFRGGRPQVYAGGAANVATILSSQKVSVDLYTSGPGPRAEAWIVDLLRKTTRANRIVFSNRGSIPVKFRGLDDSNCVVSRIDADETLPYNGPFEALEALVDDIHKYDAVILSDYKKGLVCKHTEQAISEILKRANSSTVDSKAERCHLWQHATCLTPNLSEALAIYGTDDPCEIQRATGVKVVYITRGGQSILMGCQDGMTEISVGEVIENKYTIGAGDSFAAGVTMALAKGLPYVQAGMAGVKLAEAYVSKPRRSVLK